MGKRNRGLLRCLLRTIQKCLIQKPLKNAFTTDNLKMPDSKTTKNKEEILETPQSIKKENILKTLKRKEN